MVKLGRISLAAWPVIKRTTVIGFVVLILTAGLCCAKEEPAPISETGAKELQELIETVGTTVPLPSYLPLGYKIQRVTCPGKAGFGRKEGNKFVEVLWVNIIISDSKIDDATLWHLFHSNEPSQNKDNEVAKVVAEHCIFLSIVPWGGYPLSSSAMFDFPPPRSGEKFDGIEGHIYCASDARSAGVKGCWVQWCLPNWDKPQFLLSMASWAQEVPKEELIKIAKSVKLPK